MSESLLDTNFRGHIKKLKEADENNPDYMKELEGYHIQQAIDLIDFLKQFDWTPQQQLGWDTRLSIESKIDGNPTTFISDSRYLELSPLKPADIPFIGHRANFTPLIAMQQTVGDIELRYGFYTNFDPNDEGEKYYGIFGGLKTSEDSFAVLRDFSPEQEITFLAGLNSLANTID